MAYSIPSLLEFLFVSFICFFFHKKLIFFNENNYKNRRLHLKSWRSSFHVCLLLKSLEENGPVFEMTTTMMKMVAITMMQSHWLCERMKMMMTVTMTTQE